ncbi:PKD domain-containing protein [Nibribacter koreensis]|uniref:PKD domain-containing protein n=1 Tax=Nibribacter koreensis TaxID=1084519 RepID=A0ABP8FQB5_9BACT
MNATKILWGVLLLLFWVETASFAQSTCAISLTTQGTKTLCQGGQVILKATYPKAATFVWYRDGQVIAGESKDLLTILVPGTYAVKAQDASCPSSPKSNDLVITQTMGRIIPDFSIPADTVCSGSPATFTNKSIGQNLRYSWDFGDPASGPFNYSSSPNPSHIYTSVGGEVTGYIVTLRVSSPDGCTAVIQKTVLIKQEPEPALIDLVAQFDNCANVGANNGAFTVQVSDVSITKESNAKYHIDWGDSTEEFFSDKSFKAVPHTYAKEGVYHLIVTVVGKNGCKAFKEYTVKNIGKPEGLVLRAPPANPDGCGPHSITYSLNQPNNAKTTLYTIDFGDGSPLVSLPHPPPATITHVFDSASCAVPGKRFTIQTTASNACKTTMNTFKGPEVYKAPVPFFSVSNNGSNCVNQPLVFKNLSEAGANTDCSSAVQYTWDFGDGTKLGPFTDVNGSKPQQTHQYAKAGTYTVILTAQNGCGVSEIKRQVCISATEAASFTIEKPRATSCTADVFVLRQQQATSANGCTDRKVKWQVEPSQGVAFVNNTTNLSEEAQISFALPGEYTIGLTVTNACGTETTSQILKVTGKPAVAFLQKQAVYCAPQKVKMGAEGTCHALSVTAGSSPISAYNWILPRGATFAQGSTASSASPEVVFSEKGEYRMGLVVSSLCGPADTTFQTISFFDGNQALSLVGDTVICEGKAAILSVRNPVGIYKWYTQPTGGTLIYTGNIYSTPPLTKSLTCYVEEESTMGCVGTTRKEVRIQVYPASIVNKLTLTQTVQCAGESPPVITGSNPSDVNVGYAYKWQMSEDGYHFVEAAGANQGKDYQAPSLSKDTWFRRVVIGGSCFEAISDTVKIRRVTKPVAPVLLSKTVCAGQGVSLQVVSPKTHEVYKWFTHATGGTELGETATLALPTILRDTVFYVQANAAGSACASSTRTKVTVTVLPALVNNTITGSQSICPGARMTPFVGSTPSGGDGTYTYQWEYSADNSVFVPAPGTSKGRDYVPQPLDKTTWFRRVVTSGDCFSSASDAIKITVSPPIANNSIGPDQVACVGQAPKVIWGTEVTGGGGTYAYLWESSDIGPTGGFVPAPGVNTGKDYQPPQVKDTRWYRRVVTAAPCQQSISTAVAVKTEPLPKLNSLAHLNQKVCAGQSAKFEISNTQWQYKWYSQPTGGVVLHTGNVFTSPRLQKEAVFYVEAVSSSGCVSLEREPVKAEVVRPEVIAGPDVSILKGRGVHLRATASPAAGGKFVWSPATGLQSPEGAEVVAAPEQNTTYTVTYTSPEGCTVTDQVTVEVTPHLFVPNVITQNNDGMNDEWDIKNIESYPDCKVEVYNHWGSLVFTSNGYKTKWNGTYQGNPLPVAAYYYIIHINGQEKPITGSVTIVK